MSGAARGGDAFAYHVVQFRYSRHDDWKIRKDDEIDQSLAMKVSALTARRYTMGRLTCDFLL